MNFPSMIIKKLYHIKTVNSKTVYSAISSISYVLQCSSFQEKEKIFNDKIRQIFYYVYSVNEGKL